MIVHFRTKAKKGGGGTKAHKNPENKTQDSAQYVCNSSTGESEAEAVLDGSLGYIMSSKPG